MEEGAKPQTLLEQIKDNWKWISSVFEYGTEFLTVYWKDGRSHWHVKVYKLDAHPIVYKGEEWTEGYTLRRKDYEELQQIADRFRAGYCSMRRDPHTISPRKEEQQIRRWAYSPEGFRNKLRIFSPDEWRSYWKFKPPKWLEDGE